MKSLVSGNGRAMTTAAAIRSEGLAHGHSHRVTDGGVMAKGIRYALGTLLGTIGIANASTPTGSNQRNALIQQFKAVN